MTDEQFNQFMDKLEQRLSGKVGDEAQASAATKIFGDALKDFGKDWKSSVQKAQESEAKTKADLEQLQKEHEEISKEFKTLKSQVEVEAAAALFNDRVKAVEDKFELSEAQIKIVVEDVKALGPDEKDFEKYLTRASVLFSEFDKETKEDREKAKEAAIAEAAKKLAKGENTGENAEGEEEELETEGSEGSVPPNSNEGQSGEGETLIDRIKKNGLELEGQDKE